jgi:CheY-like chemotaxis protein
VRQIINALLHSSSITATSAGRNQGTTVQTKLHLLPATVTPTARMSNSQPTALPCRQSNHGESPRRILLVEDHLPTSRALMLLLTRRNYEVVAAPSVAEARAIASREKFDLLISDIGLPDGNGYELMAELHSRHRLVGIALTGYGTERDVSRSHAAGFVTHLTKPVSVQALEGALSAIPR